MKKIISFFKILLDLVVYLLGGEVLEDFFREGIDKEECSRQGGCSDKSS